MKMFLISLSVFFLDQVTKWIAKTQIGLRESVEVFGDTIRLTHIQNQGMAFGIAIPNKYFFNILSLIAAGAILYYLIRFRNIKFLPRFSLAVIFGGAIGNLLDRIMLGEVVDFIDVNIPDINIPSYNLFLFETPGIYLERWPIFNVADVAVSVGMFLLIYTIISSENPWHKHATINVIWFKDIYSRQIKLTAERKEHIEIIHPEMRGQVDKLSETLENPDMIIKTKADPTVELFFRNYDDTPVTKKYLCVAVKVLGSNLFIITAFFTSAIKSGEILWKRK